MKTGWRNWAGAVATLAVWLSGGVAWSRVHHRAPVAATSTTEPPYAFDVCIAQVTGPSPAHLGWNDGVLSAVVRTLAPTERGTLEVALGDAAMRWEARANPMLDDLEGGDPDAALVTWFKTAPSFVRTAQASAKLQSCSPDGLCVSPRTIGAACPAGSAPPKSADEDDRGRFLLWTWGHALRFRASSPEAARSAAAVLREHARSSRAIAIVMTSEDAEATKVAPFATMRRGWETVGGLKAASRRDRKTPMSTFAIDERADEVIVLPRLEAISTGAPDAAVLREVTAVAPQLSPRRN